jgi:hypothetical protein
MSKFRTFTGSLWSRGEPWKAVDSRNRDLEAENGVLEDL